MSASGEGASAPNPFGGFDEPLKAMIRDFNASETRLAVLIPGIGLPNEEGLRRSAYVIDLIDGKGHSIVWAGDSLEEGVKALMEWEDDYMAVVPIMIAGHAYKVAQEQARRSIEGDISRDDGEPV